MAIYIFLGWFFFSSSLLGETLENDLGSVLEEMEQDDLESSKYKKEIAKDRQLKLYNNFYSIFAKAIIGPKYSDLNLGFGWQNISPLEKWAMVPRAGVGIFYTGDKDFRRIDFIRISASTDPLGIFNKLPVYGLGAHIRDIKYMRYFENATKAKLATPKFIVLPLRSQMVKKYMQEGDVFATTVMLNFATGNTIPVPFGPTWGFFHNNEAVLSGFYDVAIQRLNENRARVRIKFNDHESGGVLENFTPIYLLTGIDVVNAVVSNFVYLNLHSTIMSKNHFDTRHFDYLFNLNDADACEAYDLLFDKLKKFRKGFDSSKRRNILKDRKKQCEKSRNRNLINDKNKQKSGSGKQKWKVKNIKNYFGKSQQKFHNLISDIRPIKKIILQDRDKPTAEKRIREIMDAHLSENAVINSTSTGLVLHQDYRSTTYEKYSFIDEEEKVDKKPTKFVVRTKFKGTKKAFGLNPNTSYIEEFLGVENTADEQIDLMGRYYKIRHHRFRKAKRKKLMLYLRRNLPKTIVNELEFDQFFSNEISPKNVMIKTRITFSRDFLDHMSRNISADFSAFSSSFEDYKKILKEEKIWTPNKLINGKLRARKYEEKGLLKNIYMMVFDSSKRTQSLWKKIVNKKVYYKVGMGFLWHLARDLDRSDLENMVSISVSLASPHPEIENYSYEFGKVSPNSDFDRASNARWHLFYAPRDFREI